MNEGELPGDSGVPDRRQDTRTTAVYRPVLLETEGFTGFCLLRNLSPSGLMGIAYAQFAEGEEVNVQFLPGHVVAGKIVWSKDGKIGVEFHQEIDTAESLKAMGSNYVETKVNRAPRLPMDCEGEAEIDGRRWTIRLHDISQRGIKAELPSARPGDEVIVYLPWMEPRKAIVRWSQFPLAGLNFVRPIAFEELARWAIDRQAERDQGRVASAS